MAFTTRQLRSADGNSFVIWIQNTNSMFFLCIVEGQTVFYLCPKCSYVFIMTYAIDISFCFCFVFRFQEIENS